jgi:hypothetical protein
MDMGLTPELSTSLVGFTATFLAVLASIRQIKRSEERLGRRMDSLEVHVGERLTDVGRRIDDARDILRADMLQVEQVMDARLRRLEER